MVVKEQGGVQAVAQSSSTSTSTVVTTTTTASSNGTETGMQDTSISREGGGVVVRRPNRVLFYGDDEEDDDNNENEQQDNHDTNQQTVEDDNDVFRSSSSTSSSSSTYATFFGAVANLCSATLGAGVLALPFAFVQAGLVGGFVLLLGSAWATSISITVLVRACDVYGMTTYEEVVQHVLGKRARQIVEISILLFCIGCAVAYLIAVGDIVEQLVLIEEEEENGDESGGNNNDHWDAATQRRWAIVLVWLFAMLPLSCLRRMKSLQCASGVGLASIGTLLLAATVHMVQHYNDDMTSPSISFEGAYYGMTYTAATTTTTILESDGTGSDSGDDGSGRMWWSWLWTILHKLKPFVGPAPGGILSILRACPIVLFSFSCQVNVCQIYDELPGGSTRQQEQVSHRRPPPPHSSSSKIRTMTGITWTAMALCGFLYTSISLVTLIDFGSLLQPNVLSCYHPTKSPRDMLLHGAFAAMAVAVVMAFPLNIFPARVTIFQMCLTHKPRDQTTEADATTDILSLVQQHDGGSGGRGGGERTHDTIHNNNNTGESHPVGALSQPLLTRHQRDVEEQEERGSSTHQESHDDDDDDVANPIDGSPSLSYTSSTSQHMLVTFFVAGLALTLALIVPNISIVFGLLGGTTASLLGFVIPGWLGLHLDINSEEEETHYHYRTKAWFLVIAGSVVGVLTTAVTLYSTLQDLGIV